MAKRATARRGTDDAGKGAYTRPIPPEALFEDFNTLFLPAPEVLAWIKAVILDERGPLYNEEHVHLRDAHLGILWTNATSARRGRQVIGEAEVPMFNCGGWKRARQEMQIEQWFGAMPDFLITLDAHYCAECTDLEFAALVEHELYHCAQARNEMGIPVFNRDTGLPKFTLRGHDVEEFVGIVRRYGKGAPEGALAKLVEAANLTPEVARIDIARACGTCQLKAV